MTRYEYAKDLYAKIGIDTEEAIKKLSALPISMHCWQGDDVVGFDSKEALSGGIQTTGNYPGKATRLVQLSPARRSSIFTRAMQFLKTVSLMTEMHSSRSTSQDGWNMQRKEEWVLTSTPHISHTRW